MTKNSVPSTAVARESAFAWPRPVMKLPVPASRPERPALGALQQNDRHQGEHDQDMNDDQHGLHEEYLRAGTAEPEDRRP